MDANLYFANASAFKDLVLEADVKSPALQTIVIDMYPVNRIDSTGVEALEEVIETCRRHGVTVLLAGVKGPVRDVLDDAGVSNDLGEDNFFLEVHAAVQRAEAIAENNVDDGETEARERATSTA
jgi:SulP family sulfate permease